MIKKNIKNKCFVYFAIFLYSLTLLTKAIAGESSGPNPGSKLAVKGIPDTVLYTGAFSYTYPIEVPDARGGIQPDLKLIYNSNFGNGWLGIGFDLSVGGAIYRSTKEGMPEYNANDTYIFSLQGTTQELVKTGTDSIGSYEEYRAKIEPGNFIKFRYYSATNKWYAWDKKGTKYQFEDLFNSFYWGLTKVTGVDEVDVMTISYTNPSTGSEIQLASMPSGTIGYLPKKIVYRDELTVIDFNFEERVDKIIYYRAGHKQELGYRLKEIIVTSNNERISKHVLKYEETESNLSKLISIQQYGSDDTSVLPSTEFNYSNAEINWETKEEYLPPTYFLKLTYDYPSIYAKADSRMIDVNGDGLLDIVKKKNFS